MISSSTTFNGFDARSWHRLITLFAPGLASFAPHEYNARAERDGGTLVIVYNPQGLVHAIHTQRGVLRALEWEGPSSLSTLATAHGAHFAIAIEASTLAGLYERIGGRVRLDDDAIATTLLILAAIRECTDRGQIHFWPDLIPQRVPLPTPTVVRGVFDFFLPPERSAALVLFDKQHIDTAIIVQRRGDVITRIEGPERIRLHVAPHARDFREEVGVLRNAIEASGPPLSFGLFAETPTLHQLLRETRSGAWAEAIMRRSIVFSPLPPWVGIAAGSGAAHAFAQQASSLLAQLPIEQFAQPLLDRVRTLRTAWSTSQTLGFNPLQALSDFLRRTSPTNSPPRDPTVE